MEKQFDFSGWATKANIKCSDGRTIMKDAFKHNDGQKVPLVWNHKHDAVDEVLGHALLENREEGVYAYCKFNDTESGKTAKLLVEHGDVDQLSIYANQLKQQGPYVMHGNIRELSLVLAGANPGAYIENVIMAHGDDNYELDDEARIWTGEFISLSHAAAKDEEEVKEEEESPVEEEPETKEESKEESEDADEKTKVKKEASKEEPKVEEDEEDEDEEPSIEHSDEPKETSAETLGDVFNTLNKEQQTVVYALISDILGETDDDDDEDDDDEEEVKHSDEKSENSEDSDDKTVGDVLKTLNEKQETVVYALIGEAIKQATNNKDDESEGGNETMKQNAFEQNGRVEEQQEVLTHSELMEIVQDIPRFGSFKESCLQHGIESIGEFFPEVKTVGETPDLLKRNDGWVSEVLNGVHRSPFARIKTMYADITAEEARAKGYVKGNLKVEEVIKAFKRTTPPTTVYKKQKLDRDDIVDITEFDVIAFLRAEMRMMLEEEVARAILIGDGREVDDNDHIDEECIRPIWTDSDVYTVKAKIEVAASASAEDKAKAFIKAAVKNRKNYKGSGSPVMYMSEDILTDCLLIEDTNGRRIYETIDKLAGALTVKKIVPVTVMDNVTRTVDGATHTLAGLYVNLNDYNVGADKGGAVTMFDDFDIDYNQQKYLIETRMSGALTKPAAAVALEFVTAEAEG